MSSLPGVKQIGKATGLKGRPLGVVMIGIGAALIIASVPEDLSIVGLPAGIILDLLGVAAVLVGIVMLVTG